jgi:hypothetical protein
LTDTKSRIPYDAVLYLTRLEIIQCQQSGFSKAARGDECLSPITIIQILSRPFAIPFPTESIEDLLKIATPTGKLNGKNLQTVPTYSSCVPGSWIATEPTMIAMVTVTLDGNNVNALRVHTEKKATSFLDPLPPITYTDPVPTPTDTAQQIVTPSPPAGNGQTPNDFPQETGTDTADGSPQESIGGFYIPLPTPVALYSPQGPSLSVFGEIITAGSGKLVFVIDGQTLANGEVITDSGFNIVSLDQNPTPVIANVNGTPQPLASITQPPTLYISGVPIPEQADGAFIINSQTILPGQTIIVAGTTISLGAGPSPSNIVINGVTSSLSPTLLPVLTISGTTYTASPLPGEYVIGGQTLDPGGPAITVSGSTFSLAPGGSTVVINGHTSVLGVTNATTMSTRNSDTTMGIAQIATSSVKAGATRDFLAQSSSFCILFSTVSVLLAMVVA